MVPLGWGTLPLPPDWELGGERDGSQAFRSWNLITPLGEVEVGKIVLPGNMKSDIETYMNMPCDPAVPLLEISLREQGCTEMCVQVGNHKISTGI